MPRRDGTGPFGMGPMTGRCAGYCSENANAVGFARGFGCGYGYNHGYKRMLHTTDKPDSYAYPGHTGATGYAFDEKVFLNKQATFLEQQLEQVNKRISDLSDASD